MSVYGTTLVVAAEGRNVAESKPRIDAPRRAGGDGTPEVFCSDEQDDVPLDLNQWRSLALNTLAEEGVRGACELNLYFIDEASIADLNSEHMGKLGPTDVLAFPLDGIEVMESQGPGALTRGPARPHHDHDDVPILLGDVLLCPAIAKSQAPSHAGNLDDEIALLVVHGTLHILGYDHDEEEERLKMREREVSILMKHHWSGPVPAGFRQEQDS